jgi:hypothetical protein
MLPAFRPQAAERSRNSLCARDRVDLPSERAGTIQTRPNKSGKLFFSPLAIFSIFTRDTFLTPLSTPL